MSDKTITRLMFAILILAVASLFVENTAHDIPYGHVIVHVIDFAIIGLFILELILRYAMAKYKMIFIKQNLLYILFIIFFCTLLGISKYIHFTMTEAQLEDLSVQLILLRNVFIGLKIFSRFNKLNYFIQKLARNPAQTIILSFVVLILVGALMLMMPFSTADGSRMPFADALFTATSAACVTGLTVADTATYFSVIGKLTIMVLIQLGGLGIMIFTFFTSFMLGRRISLKDSLTLSYMLDERDMRNLARTIMKIILVTFAIEAAGAVLLFMVFGPEFGFGLRAIFYAVFHAVSAFCNAGFALFTDSLMSFKSDGLLNVTVAGLIILGGIGFGVLINVAAYMRSQLRENGNGRMKPRAKLTLNSKAVLSISAGLIIVGMFLIYGMEHGNQLIADGMKTQYLSAFFQSVTLRTAGFNTMDISALTVPTYLIMMLFMFIGGAAGSTAGGIKVNSVGVIYAYVKSILKNSPNAVLFKSSIERGIISRAFLVTVFAMLTVFAGTFLLSMFEDFSLVQIAFESVSAFGTVGLSTGITPALTLPGKAVIVALMFAGRLGPLTLIAALALGKTKPIVYPEGYISIG